MSNKNLIIIYDKFNAHTESCHMHSHWQLNKREGEAKKNGLKSSF